MILVIYGRTNQAQNFKCNSENAPTKSILTDRCKIKIFYKGKGNGKDWRGGVINDPSAVVGMIK